MCRKVWKVDETTAIAEPAPIFANTGHHYPPVVDPDEQLIGMITPADLITGLYRQTQTYEPRMRSV
jgi:CBS domain-containing membrane protein